MNKLFTLICICFHFISMSQVHSIPNNTNVKGKVFKAIITDRAGESLMGYIGAFNDSAIWLTDDAASIRFNMVERESLAAIHYRNIEKVIVRRKNATGRGLLFGALAGLGTGITTGLIIGDDPPCYYSGPADPSNLFGLGTALCEAFRTSATQKAVALGGAGALGGAIIGGVIGAVAKKRYVINGRKEGFQTLQLSVLERIYANPHH